VQFALYNTHGSIPDEDYTKYYRKSAAKIKNRSAEITFSNLPRGKYAVNVLHDEDKDGKVKKGLILPKEGIGFSNFTSLKISTVRASLKLHLILRGKRNRSSNNIPVK
jgi:uncharacterized protein (DUF2141 family)